MRELQKKLSLLTEEKEALQRYANAWTNVLVFMISFWKASGIAAIWNTVSYDRSIEETRNEHDIGAIRERKEQFTASVRWIDSQMLEEKVGVYINGRIKQQRVKELLRELLAGGGD